VAIIDNEDPHGIYRDWTDDLRISLHFLTRIPWPARPATEGEGEMLPLAPATRFFPVIGMIVGAIGGLVLMAAGWLQLPGLAAALLALAAIAIATGGLHEDGLADTADGIGGGPNRLARLEIMSDSHIGAYGVLALIFSVGLKAVALAALDAGDGALTLFAAAAASRGMVPVFMRWMPNAKEDGLSAAAGRPEFNPVAVSVIIAVAVLWLSFGFWISAGALLALAIVTGAMAWWILRMLGGQTGDVLGAFQQISEIVIILAVTAAASMPAQ
jgi:adenosylcobinamide-GDP ribazoletransferase